MSQLYLFIDDLWPAQHTQARWYWLDDRGRVLRQGCSEPRHWPGVCPPQEGAAPPQAVTVMLSGAQVACQRLRLPPGKAGRRPEILAAAIEERLLQPPEDCLLLPGAVDEAGLTAVAVLARERLRLILAGLRELGLAPLAAWPLGFLLPSEAGRRCARLEAGYLTLPLAGQGFMGWDLDAGGAENPGWAALLAPHWPQPPTVNVAGEAAVPPPSLPAGWQCRAEPADRLPLALPSGPGFLTGELAPRRGRWPGGAAYRPAARLAAGMLALWLVLSGVEWFRLAQQSRQLQDETAAVFREAFPQAAMVDPLLQMQRQVDGLRRQVGEAAAGDLPAMLDRLAGQGGMTWQGFEFSSGRLEADLLLPPSTLEALAAMNGGSGYGVQVLSQAPQADGQVKTRLRMTLGGKR